MVQSEYNFPKITKYNPYEGQNIPIYHGGGGGIFTYLSSLAKVLIPFQSDCSDLAGNNWVAFPKLPEIKDVSSIEGAPSKYAAYFDGSAGMRTNSVNDNPKIAENKPFRFSVDFYVPSSVGITTNDEKPWTIFGDESYGSPICTLFTGVSKHKLYADTSSNSNIAAISGTSGYHRSDTEIIFDEKVGDFTDKWWHFEINRGKDNVSTFTLNGTTYNLKTKLAGSIGNASFTFCIGRENTGQNNFKGYLANLSLYELDYKTSAGGKIY